MTSGAERARVRELERSAFLLEQFKDTEFQGNARADRRRQVKTMDKYAKLVARMTKHRAKTTKTEK